MPLHPALHQPFKGRAYFSAFPGPLPALCARDALFILCFYHNFSKSSPGQPLACCWGGAVHVTQLFSICYSGEDGRGDEATLGFRGGRLPVLSQASQDWLLPMVVSQVLQALQYAEK